MGHPPKRRLVGLWRPEEGQTEEEFAAFVREQILERLRGTGTRVVEAVDPVDE